VVSSARGFNFDEIKMGWRMGGLHDKHAVAVWNLGTTSACAWKKAKNKETCVEMACSRTFRMHADF
jgi:hypothetical protein